MKSTITVCDTCLRASCWQGLFLCDRAVSASIVELTLIELMGLDLESPNYWMTRAECDCYTRLGINGCNCG